MLGSFATQIVNAKYAQSRGGVLETWPEISERVASHVLGALGYKPASDEVYGVYEMLRDRKFLPGGRYLYASGRDLHQVNNCLLLRCEDTREGWADTFWKSGMALMTGAGIGVNYSRVRARGELISRTGGVASGPLSPMRIINEIGRDIMQGGSRRSAIWAGLSWQHPDVEEFIRIKDWRPELRALKEHDITIPMEMEFTNISVTLDDEFFKAYDAGDERAHRIYRAAVSRMLKTGEPGFAIDTGDNAGEDLRNACTEITSHDDSDVCNLGSLNLGNIGSVQELADAVELSSLLLVAGTVYSDVPYPQVAEVREKNRRLGLGLMGIHEWLLQRGKPYAPDAELAEMMEVYETSDLSAWKWADEHGLSRPVKTRAIAPNGTIGIVAETTTGIEPIHCPAYLRRYLAYGTWREEYVVDPVARRLFAAGADVDSIEDAYSLSYDQRIGFQAWVQQYVDHGISSTINIPAPVTDPDEVDAFAHTLYQHLPNLRGITVYPDGARSGQPITRVSVAEALERDARVEGLEASCSGGVCGV